MPPFFTRALSTLKELWASASAFAIEWWPFVQTHHVEIGIGFLVLALVISAGPRVFFDFISFIYDLTHADSRVSIQVTMPREESAKDKEKATDKDFKEKVSIMDQLFRSLHEMHELSLSNRIMVWLFQRDTVSFEIHAKFKELTFYATCDRYYAELLEKQITAYYPTAGIKYVKIPSLHPDGKRNRLKLYYLFLKKLNWFPIKTFKELENDTLNDITNVLSKLQENERAMIQVMVRPLGDKWSKEANRFATRMFKGEKEKTGGILAAILRPFGWFFTALIFGVKKADEGTNAPGANAGDHYVRMLQTEEELAKRIGEKSHDVAYETVIRLAASSDQGESRCDEIMNGLFVSFNSVKDAASNFFQSRRYILIDFINSPLMHFALRNRLFQFWEKTSILTPAELGTIFHFPNTRYNYTPVINWLEYKILPLPNDISTEGILLGKNTYRGVEREVRFDRKDRRRHHYIIGQTGTGKSSFISYMARQDIQRGDGVCVIDPHGDLIEDILQYIPKERAKDVVIFDPADMERPQGLNMLEAHTSEQQDMASSQATEIFIKIFGDEIFGPRIQHYFRNACLTLMEDEEEGATLIDVPRIFTDDSFMRYKVSKVKNPVVKSFWDHEYANTADRERQEMIPYFSAKFGPFITNSVMRNTIGQSKSAFNFREIMDSQKILLVNLSKGKLGTLNTQLLGLILVAQIQMAAMSRVDTPEDQRKDFYLYVDEFQNFATDTFCSILSEARKYKLNLIMAHQYINQLVITKSGSTSSQIRDAVFGNVGTLQSFKVGAEDAEYLSKEFAPVLTEQDIIGIANYKSYMKLNVKNATSRPFSMDSIYDETGKNEKVREVVKKYSRMKYGRKREFVEQEITARIGIDMSSVSKSVDLSHAPTVSSESPAVTPTNETPPAAPAA